MKLCLLYKIIGNNECEQRAISYAPAPQHAEAEHALGTHALEAPPGEARNLQLESAAGLQGEGVVQVVLEPSLQPCASHE